MIDGVITFRTPTRVQDAKGIWQTTGYTERDVLVRVESAGRPEFFAAGQAGFKPEFRFTLFHDEYRGEAECAYEGATYAIYRTFRVPGTDDMELYVRRKAGIHGGA